MSTVTDPLATALAQTRQRTFDLIAEVDEDALEAVHSPLLSPLVWDLGHIAAFEDLWISRTFATEMLAPELIAVYDADETPRAERGTLPFLRRDEALDYMDRTRHRTLGTLAGAATAEAERRLELIIRHELQHNETMCQTLQIAGLSCGLATMASPHPTVCAHDGFELVLREGGDAEVGSDRAAGFSYDNEQPRHRVELPAYRIARSPVSNRAWQRFIDDGGYRRREIWSDAGWDWRNSEEVERPQFWSADGTRTRFGRTVAIDPDEPVCHVSGYEADAFVRHHGLRLPTEFEWEAAVASGDLEGAGAVWEWTATEFDGYPGFRADPYPEYSEQFFRRGYRVLRGGAWVSATRVATPQFRNWDHLQRRQIFSGLRVAANA